MVEPGEHGQTHKNVSWHVISGRLDLVNTPADDGGTPIYLSVQEGHRDCVRLLLEHHADVNMMTSSPVAMALHAAAQFNRVE